MKYETPKWEETDKPGILALKIPFNKRIRELILNPESKELQYGYTIRAKRRPDGKFTKK